MIFTPAGEGVAQADQPQAATEDIVGVTWLWQAFQDQAGISDIVVPNPEKYSLTLHADGTAAIKADCNQVLWGYILEGSSLTFNTTGPSTLAFCGEDSLDRQFLALLGDTVTFVISDGHLVLNLQYRNQFRIKPRQRLPLPILSAKDRLIWPASVFPPH